MDDFTPPPPRQLPFHDDRNRYQSPTPTAPPPIPPPPTNLPYGYRASIDTQRPQTAAGADTMPGRARSKSRGTSDRDEVESTATDPITPDEQTGRQRRGSFGFLSRSRSRTPHEIPVVTAPDGHTMLRKQKLREQEERLRLQREARDQRPPPVLPSHDPLPTINNTFGVEEVRPDSVAIISNNLKTSNFSRPSYQSPAAAMPTSASMPLLNKQAPRQQPSPSLNDLGRASPSIVSTTGDYTGSSDRHYSLASTAMSNYPSPRRVRRKKDPTPFNILVIGAKNSGKTAIIDFLKQSLALPPEKQHLSVATPKVSTNDGTFTSHYIESDLEGERVGVTVWDSQGLEKNLVDLQIRELVQFIEGKFEDTFTEESKIMRSAGSKDSLIHCVLLVLDPANLDTHLKATRQHQNNGNAFAQARGPSGLDKDLDLQVMRGLAGKTTVIPIVSKADTVSGAHMNFLKRSVWNSIQAEKLDPLDALGLDESEEDFEDSEEPSDDDPLPIQSTSSSMSGDHQHSRLDDDSDSDFVIRDSSPMAKTRSSVTTPSPGQPMKRPASRIMSRSITPGEVPNLDDMYIPFSILSPDPYELNAVGRRFPWGVADPYNPDHCDFVRLRDSVFAEWRVELRSAAREKWYESWRESRLAKNTQRVRQSGGVTPVASVPREGRATSGDRSLTPQAASGKSPALYSTSPQIRSAAY